MISVVNPELKKRCKENSALNPDLIMEVCCEIGRVKKQDMLSRKRHGDIVLARQMAMYFTYHYGCNHEEVGEIFDRDHTYSVYVVQQVDGKLDHDSLERRFFEQFTEYFPEVDTHWFKDDGSAGAGTTGYVKRKDRNKMSIIDNMIGLCMDASKILKLSGTTRSTQGSLEVTDIPTIMRKRMSEKEQEELLGLMEHKRAVEAQQPKEFRLDLNIMGENLSKKELADMVEDVSVRLRDGQASGQLFSYQDPGKPLGYYALVSKTNPGYGETRDE